MPLIVEDGTCPENANSYVSLPQADAYLLPRSLWPQTEIPDEPEKGENTDPEEQIETQSEALEETENGASDEAQEPNPSDAELPDTGRPDENPAIAAKETALIRAFDYLNTLKWLGTKADWQRQAAWPRRNVPIPGTDPDNPEFIDEDLVPDAVKRAQMELAALLYNGAELFAAVERGGKYQSMSESSSETVDVISESKSRSLAYADNAPIQDWLPSVYPLLEPFLAEVPGQTKNAFTVNGILRAG